MIQVKRLVKSLLLVCLSFGLLGQAQVGYAQSLSERREQLIIGLMSGFTKDFTLDEVEQYLTFEEVNVLETGGIRSISSYGIDNEHSTSQNITIADYLQRYLAENTTPNELDELYPFAVDFERLPAKLSFYHVDDPDHSFADFEVTNDVNKVSMYKQYWGPNQSRLNAEYIEGYPSDNQTQEVVVATSNLREERIVELNTSIRTQELSHRTDQIIYFFYNDQGGLSLLYWDYVNAPEKLEEYVTLETREELEAMGGAESVDVTPSASNDWQLPDDWRMLSPRRGEVPPVIWLLTATSDGVNFAIEPVTHQEGIVSGYINPSYRVEVTTLETMTDKKSATLYGTPDEQGYFSIDADATVGKKPTIKIFDQHEKVIYETELGVFQYQATALEHDSGLLTLKRYFINQYFMEGYTYPYAEVTVMYLDGYASTGFPPITADENGYFYAEIPGHQTNLKTNVVSVSHPDTGESISVAPYPWTEAELDDAPW